MSVIQVETYEVTEGVPSGEMEALALEGEAQLLIESLGLSGQKQLFSKDGDGSIHHPYRAMTKEEHTVFSALFPHTSDVNDYKDGPIPLRVLQIIAHVRELDHPDMQYIGVMHPPKFVDDPILFAQKTNYSGTRFILARWGYALKPFDELKESAIKKKAAIAKGELLKIKRSVEGVLEDVESYVREQFAKGDDATPAFYP